VNTTYRVLRVSWDLEAREYREAAGRAGELLKEK